MPAKGSRLKRCRRGHPLTPDTYYEKEYNGYVLRNCRRCRAIADRLRYRRSEKLQAMYKAKSKKYYAEVTRPKRSLRLGTPE